MYLLFAIVLYILTQKNLINFGIFHKWLKVVYIFFIFKNGNNYATVTIGTQTWLAENLKTTKYSDGTDIPNVTDNTAWTQLTTGAYCWYNNDSATYKNLYGALYNWYAVDKVSNENKNICPTGYHVPTDAEWYILEHYVDPTINDPNSTGGRGTDCGTKLKSTSGWINGSNGTGNYGFTTLPSGVHIYNGMIFIGYYCVYWCSTTSEVNSAWTRRIYFDHANIYRYSDNILFGYSIRCAKD